MREKLQERAFENVASVLHPGEQPIMATRAMIAPFARGGSVIVWKAAPVFSIFVNG